MEADLHPISGILRPALLSGAIALLAASCGPSYLAPPVTPQLIKISLAPVTELERGFAIHQAKCAKCHSFENPADYAISELSHEIIPEMARKAKLDMADEKAVLAYLLAARKMPLSEKPVAGAGS
ncbi:MAG: hypothetical protein ABI600_16145 [Luteolibacter sp.]